jgi:cell division transport system permease protein
MGSFALLVVNIDKLIDELEGSNDQMVAFVDETLMDDSARVLEEKLLQVPNVSSVSFITRDEAMEEFKKDFDTELFESLGSDALRHRYVIHLNDIGKMEETKELVESLDGIARVKAHLEYARGFISMRNIVSAVSFALTIILTIVSFFIMTNTIKLATYTRREEIAVMRMVGASNSFIRLPFVVEGLILGAAGGIIAFFAEWGIYSLLVNRVAAGSEGLQLITVIPFSDLISLVLFGFLGIGIAVGVFGGMSAIRSYLKV